MRINEAQSEVVESQAFGPVEQTDQLLLVYSYQLTSLAFAEEANGLNEDNGAIKDSKLLLMLITIGYGYRDALSCTGTLDFVVGSSD